MWGVCGGKIWEQTLYWIHVGGVDPYNMKSLCSHWTFLGIGVMFFLSASHVSRKARAMYRSSQPSQWTLTVRNRDQYVEVGYFGIEDNGLYALRVMTDTLASLAPETFRTGHLEAVLIHPENLYGSLPEIRDPKACTREHTFFGKEVPARIWHDVMGEDGHAFLD